MMRVQSFLRTAVIAACVTALFGCSTPVTDQGPITRVSPDYEARGDTTGMRAYLYGKRTVLDIEGDPTVVFVTDANGVSVPYERIGRFYRLSRKVNHFSVRANWRSAVFHLVPPVAVPAAAASVSVARAPELVKAAPLAPVKLEPEPPAVPTDFKALTAEAARQIKEVHQIIRTTPRDQTDWQDVSARLDRIEAQLASAKSAVVMVYFDTYKTEFAPPARLGHLIVSAAKDAAAVYLRGRTDSAVAGDLDAGIARARVESAHRYLVEHGVDAGKIAVSSLAAGDFIAPRDPATSRALNRRVEVEIVNH